MIKVNIRSSHQRYDVVRMHKRSEFLEACGVEIKASPAAP